MRLLVGCATSKRSGFGSRFHFLIDGAFLDALRERFGKFGLTLHPEKTRLIEIGVRKEALPVAPHS